MIPDFDDRLATLAYALGIRIYVDAAGRVWQHDPGGARLIEPGKSALPREHGAIEAEGNG